MILIIGILAAVAIPTFLSQTGKANDSNLQSAMNTAQTTEATYQTSNNGSYATGTTAPSALEAIEPSLTSPINNYGFTFTPYAASGTASATSGYQIVGTDSKTNVAFTLAYDATTGAITKTCTPHGTGACSASGTWGS